MFVFLEDDILTDKNILIGGKLYSLGHISRWLFWFIKSESKIVVHISLNPFEVQINFLWYHISLSLNMIHKAY